MKTKKVRLVDISLDFPYEMSEEEIINQLYSKGFKTVSIKEMHDETDGIDFEDLIEEFNLIKNPIETNSWSGYYFDSISPDMNIVNKFPKENIITLIEGDDDGIYADSGFHIVNRLGYFLTEKPIKEEFCLLIL